MTLDSIIERLEKTESGDRELDREIGLSVGGASENQEFGMAGNWYTQYRSGGRNGLVTSPEPYTSSVDAAIALAEKVLPGWAWKVGTCSVSDDAWITPDFNSPIHGERLKREFPDLKAGSAFDTGFDIDLRPSGRPAIALCIAVLTALKAKQEVAS